MYLGGLKSDIKSALKGSNAAKIEKALAAEQKKFDKNPTSKKAVKRADYIAQLQTRLATVKAPPAVTTPAPTDNPYPGMPANVPTTAPPAASESTALIPSPAATGIPAASFGPAFGPATDQPQFDPATSEVAPVAESSNMPLILGALGLGAFFLFMKGKRR